MDNKDLAIITCYFNPAGYQSKKRLFAELKARIPDVFTVELLNNDGLGNVSEKEIDSDLQVTGSVLWQKERLLNIGIMNRIHAGYKNVCWIDLDCEFVAGSDVNEYNYHWKDKVLECLATNSLIQCFSEFTSEYTDMKINGESFAKSLINHDQNAKSRSNGTVWAATSELFVAGFRLYDRHVTGAGDGILGLFAKYGITGNLPDIYQFTRENKSFSNDIYDWMEYNIFLIRNKVGYINQKVILHSHGKFINRRYGSANQILADYNFNPHADVGFLFEQGLIWLTDKPALHKSVADYFFSRKEDDI